MTKTILVVDDEKDIEVLIRQKFRKKIRDKEFNFIFAYDGLHALEIINNSKQPDLVLTDINMPKMDGLTLLIELAKLYPLLKVVIISAYGDMENIRTAMNRGAYDFLTKPIDLNDLEITIYRTLKHAEELKSYAKKHDELISIQQELNIAGKIQNAILSNKPQNMLKIDIDLLYHPMALIGGDFYDFHIIDENKIGILIADVSGHGVPAALIASMVKVAFSTQRMNYDKPDVLLKEINNTLSVIEWNDNFLTACYIFIDLEKKVLSYANAGHPPFALLRKTDNTLQAVNTPGSVIGLFPDLKVKPNQITIKPGDRIVLYTDGIIECTDNQDTMFGEEMFFQFIQNNQHFTANEFKNLLMAELIKWNGNEDMEDDITMVIVDILG